MIRVVFAVDAAFLGGAELYVSRLAHALDPASFSVSVVMRRSPDGGALHAWADDLEASGVRVIRTGMELPRRPGHALRILRALDSIAPHVVHVNMPGPYSGQNALLVPLARLSGARVLVTEHLPMVAPLWKRAALKRAAYRWLDLAVTVSHANAVFVRERQGVPATRIRVVYNGVEAVEAPAWVRREVRAALSVPPDAVLIWFVGNLLAHKGLQDTLHALSKLRTPHWLLVVIGEGPERDAAVALARTAGCSDRVRFLGHRPHDEVRAMLPAGDLLALPSRIEGLPYSVLEAMASRLPVVSTAVFGIPEAVADGETGLLVAPGDSEGLAHAFERLVADADARARMGAAAYERYTAMFTIEKQAAAMSRIYRELATGRNSA
jgi:glycosyltransferase involved in cell wall biosynthesis